MSNAWSVKASGDKRFIPNRHFILTDVEAGFLLRHKVNMSVQKFRAFLRGFTPAFHALAGDLRTGKTQYVKVYDIEQIKRALQCSEQLSFVIP